MLTGPSLPAPVLQQMTELARQFGALYGRENDHYRDVSEALTELGESVGELRQTVTGHARSSRPSMGLPRGSQS